MRFTRSFRGHKNLKTPMNKQKLALLALVAMAIVWGYNWVVMKKVLAYVGPFDFTAYRTSLGALALLIVLWGKRESAQVVRKAWLRIAVLGILQTGFFSLLIQLALLQGNAGKSSILTYTMPFWVIPMAWVAFGERVRGLQWVAISMAAAGLIFILQPWASRGSLASEGYALAAGFCWAVAAMVAKWIKRDFDIPALHLTAWQMLCGALALTLCSALVPEQSVTPAPYFFAALFYNALLATSLAWFLWLFALQHLSAGVAGMTALGVPVVSVLAGWLELGERPAGMDLVGMVLIALALTLVSVIAIKKPAGSRAS